MIKSLITCTMSLVLLCCVTQRTLSQNSTLTNEVNTSEIDSVRYMDQVNSIAELDIMQEAFEYIESTDDQTVETQIHLNEIPAPPFMEEQRAARYAELMQEYGLEDVTIDNEGNVIGKRAGQVGDKTIVISAHLDTVFPEGTDVRVTVKNDTLYAPGISDDARGLTTVLTILRTLNEKDIKTNDNIWFVGTVGEEGLGDLRGVKHLFRDGHEIDAFISIDGSNSTRIVNKALGSHRYKVTYNGPGGHSWGAFGIANPAHALGHAVSEFDKRASSFIETAPRTSYNVGRISGGTSVNSVPFENWMEIDMRSVSVQSLNEIDAILKDAIEHGLNQANDTKNHGEDLTVQTEMIGERPSGEIDEREPFIQRAIAATKYFGDDHQLVRSSTDSNVPISLGIPSMTLGGGGDSSGSHSLDEWWLNKNGHEAIQRALLILISEAEIYQN